MARIPRGDTALGRLVRVPLRLIPRGARVPIVSGPARGMTWVVSTSDHGCWLGTYEAEKQRLIAALLRPGGVAYDLGAHAGLFTLICARAVAPGGEVVAFEPLPENVANVREHVRLNGLGHVRVEAAAVSDADGEVRFTRGKKSSQGSIGDGGMTVRTVTLDRFVLAEGRRPPDLIKIDVEGAETAVLRGGREVIQTHRPVLVLATHSDRLLDECSSLLRDWGYDVEAPWRQAHELVCTPAPRR